MEYLIHLTEQQPSFFFLFILFKCYFQIGSQSEAETLCGGKGQIKSGGGLLLTSKVPLWVCFCVQRLHWEMNLEPWQACRCSPTWTHAEGDPSARAALIPHWHTALSTTSNHWPLMHRKLQKKNKINKGAVLCGAVNTQCLSYVATALRFQLRTALIFDHCRCSQRQRVNDWNTSVRRIAGKFFHQEKRVDVWVTFSSWIECKFAKNLCEKTGRVITCQCCLHWPQKIR